MPPSEGPAPAELLEPGFVLLDVDATDDESIIRRLSQHLLGLGMVRETHADATVARERVYPTGLALGEFNAALPHTDPEHVVRNAIAVAVPRRPVTFSHMAAPEQRTDVHVVIMLAINDKEAMVPLLASLALMLQDGVTVGAMATAASAEELVGAFRAGVAATEGAS